MALDKYIKGLMCSCHFCKLGKFSDFVGELTNNVISDKEIIDDNLDLFDEEYNSEMYIFVVKNSYVGLTYTVCQNHLSYFIC